MDDTDRNARSLRPTRALVGARARFTDVGMTSEVVIEPKSPVASPRCLPESSSSPLPIRAWP
jgi:hypothetical protein